jgi:formylmethanofuran dehydrogenase subunit C
MDELKLRNGPTKQQLLRADGSCGLSVFAGQIAVAGTIDLGAELSPGEYALQVIVTDNLAKEKKYQAATRWIDFELVQQY